MSRPSLGKGWFQVSTSLGDFVTLLFIRGCALGTSEASALGGKMSSPCDQVRWRCFACLVRFCVLWFVRIKS